MKLSQLGTHFVLVFFAGFFLYLCFFYRVEVRCKEYTPTREENPMPGPASHEGGGAPR